VTQRVSVAGYDSRFLSALAQVNANASARRERAVMSRRASSAVDPDTDWRSEVRMKPRVNASCPAGHDAIHSSGSMHGKR
jgi:hypothetical protein